MKYRQLTKEQFEELHEEFAQFLATQQIDAEEWKDIKTNRPHVAEEEMNLFSDNVWENVLNGTEYVEHFSKGSVNLFFCEKEEIHRIMIKSKDESVDLTSQKGIDFLLGKPVNHDFFDYYKASKKYNGERNLEIFDLILKGSSISKDGALYKNFEQLVK